jgi:Tol biopolymer transport system component
VAGSADRRARFEPESRAVAALSHPNILALFDIGADGDQLFAVTELLDGQTLAERLREGPVPTRKAVEIAIAVARGLAAAHDRGIAHRDLKPANVFLLADGQVQLLDFGLARQTSALSGATETHTALTDPGTILGTAGYMAPEQIRGQAVDGRADLFALGVVLYEMLTGARAFSRGTTVETLNAILTEDPPDITRTRSDISPALERIVRHAMERNPAERFQTARDVAFALDALSGSSSSAAMAAVAPAASKPRQLALAAAAAAATGATMVALAVPAPSVQRPYDTLTPFAVDERVETAPAWSPDGSALADVAEVDGVRQILSRQISKPIATQLTHLSTDCDLPQWDDSGRRVLFLSENAIWSVSATGGQPERLVSSVERFVVLRGQDAHLFQKSASSPSFVQFALDGSDDSVLWRVGLAGGTPERFALPDLAPAGSVTPGQLMGVSFSARGSMMLVGVLDSLGMKSESIWTAPVDGRSPLRRIQLRLPASFEGRVSLREPRWFNDDRRVVFELIRRHINDRSLWVLDTETGSVSPLCEATDVSYAPAIAPGDGAMAFVSSALDWNIAELDIASGELRPLVSGTRYGLGVLLIHRHRLDPARCVYVGSSAADPGFARKLGFAYRRHHSRW